MPGLAAVATPAEISQIVDGMEALVKIVRENNCQCLACIAIRTGIRIADDDC